MSKIIHLGGFLCRLFRPSLKTDLLLKGNVLKPLAKNILVPSGLTTAASTTDAAIQKKIYGSDTAT